MLHFFIKFLLTGFNSGLIKYMPGTCGTLVAVFLYYFFFNNSIEINVLLLLILLLLSFLALNYSYSKSIFKEVDDKTIVIDEIIGFLSFMIFFEPTINNIIIGFVLFRFFDIVKPFPIYLVDRNLKNAFGVIFDDMIAGFFAGVILYLIINVF